MVAVSASFMLTKDHAAEKSLEIIFISVDYLQSGLPLIFLDCLQPLPVLSVRVDVGVVEKAHHFPTFLTQGLQRGDEAIGATDMDQSLHFPFRSFKAACAAASRAMGTRKGEQLT
jgi:hypothetical protein